MRCRFSCVLAALVAAFVLPGHASAADSLESCRWEPLARYIGLVPRAFAASPDGTLLLAGDDYTDPARPALRVLRGDSAGNWQEADRWLPAGAAGTGVHALHVDAQGNAYLLAWVQTQTGNDLVLRRSFGDGAAGTWQLAEERWPGARTGALTSDPDGRLYVAHSLAQGIGWRVVSALRGMGAFTVEDEFRPAGARVTGALPLDFERGSDGSLVVAGQLDGEPDEWVVRQSRLRKTGRAAWQTIDRFRLSATSYGLLPRAVVPLGNGGVVAVGAGVPGGAAHDYRWLGRRRLAAGNRWATQSYQLVAGQHSEAHDAVVGGAGIAAVGIGQTPGGHRLQLRESADNGQTWKTVVELAGVEKLPARIVASGPSLWVTAVIQGAAVVVGCER
jgi:hypothetical protein